LVYSIKLLKKIKRNLTQNNIFIFGIKPTMPSSEFGYFLTKNNKVTRFVEKPKELKLNK
jgi:mannose-1-phosphate guanylyltransferase